jgi:hypothetical protein
MKGKKENEMLAQLLTIIEVLIRYIFYIQYISKIEYSNLQNIGYYLNYHSPSTEEGDLKQ